MPLTMKSGLRLAMLSTMRATVSVPPKRSTCCRSCSPGTINTERGLRAKRMTTVVAMLATDPQAGLCELKPTMAQPTVTAAPTMMEMV